MTALPVAMAQDETAVVEAAATETETPPAAEEAAAPTDEAAPAPEATDADTPAAEEEEASTADALAALADGADILWVCLAAFLVFFMQAGFALVETGFTRAKNACNIIMKNVMDFSIGSLVFWLFGFGMMFGVSGMGGLIGTTFYFFDASSESVALEAMGKSEGFAWSFLIFQTVFAATAATIVSGAMAERTKFVGYLAYSVLITAIVYPVFGHWAWGNLWAGTSWLADKGFVDFAGSTVVHSIGGWCALAGAIVLGARIGKFSKEGKPQPIPGHNIPLAALGVFILWLGWFGFNPGSTTALGAGEFARVAVTTNLAAAAGAMTAMITAWVMFKKPDPSFTLNGALAGLVGITAGCYNMTPLGATVVGLIAGVLVVVSVVVVDRIRIDDPVGAVSVHGVCGAFGTIAVGLWGVNYGDTVEAIGLFNGGGASQLMTQLLGVGVAFAWAFPVSLGIFLLIKYTIGLRVSEAEEREGLDIHEHGMLAYPPQMVTDTFAGTTMGMPGMSAASSGGGYAPAVSRVASSEGA
ncbi:MAG: ammonium transporter [Planctomycetales bacterium]|nr:ammonium transporter [Planctomycetales bacterium]